MDLFLCDSDLRHEKVNISTKLYKKIEIELASVTIGQYVDQVKIKDIFTMDTKESMQ